MTQAAKVSHKMIIIRIIIKMTIQKEKNNNSRKHCIEIWSRLAVTWARSYPQISRNQNVILGKSYYRKTALALVTFDSQHFLPFLVGLHLLRQRQQGERQHVVMLVVGMLSEVSATIVLGSTKWCLTASSWRASITARQETFKMCTSDFS